MWRANRDLSFADLLEISDLQNLHQPLAGRALGLGLPVSILCQAGICTRAAVVSSLM